MYVHVIPAQLARKIRFSIFSVYSKGWNEDVIYLCDIDGRTIGGGSVRGFLCKEIQRDIEDLEDETQCDFRVSYITIV